MKLVDNELQIGEDEADTTRSILALNAAQDFLETLLAQQPDLFGDSKGNIVTAASTESTAYPPNLLRLDRMQLLDSNTSRPKMDLVRLHRTGGHMAGRFWPLNWVTTASSAGEPTAYWTDGRSIYWLPLPSGVHTVRWYGFTSAADITYNGHFNYPDAFKMPIAAFATKLMALGKGDSAEDLDSVAGMTFGPAIKMVSNFNRDGARPFEYDHLHIT